MNLFSAENSATLFQLQSLAILAIMFIGVYIHRQRKKHVALMGTAIVWDVILILQIELTRSAIDKASQISANPTMLNIHVTIAVLCVILYATMIFTGQKLLKGQNQWRNRHRLLGIITLNMRILTFATSFFTVTAQG